MGNIAKLILHVKYISKYLNKNERTKYLVIDSSNFGHYDFNLENILEKHIYIAKNGLSG